MNSIMPLNEEYEVEKKEVTDMNENWNAVSWHCANCGAIVTGYRDSKGNVKVECSFCRAVMYSKPMGRRHDRIDIYAPYGQERVS